jgi:hypothetical protein
VVATGLEESHHSSGNAAIPNQGGADSGAQVSIDPQLGRLIEAWPGLPGDTRERIVALIDEAMPTSE